MAEAVQTTGIGRRRRCWCTRRDLSCPHCGGDRPLPGLGTSSSSSQETKKVEAAAAAAAAANGSRRGGGVMEGATATCGYRRTRPHVAFRRCAPTRRPPPTRRKLPVHPSPKHPPPSSTAQSCPRKSRRLRPHLRPRRPLRRPTMATACGRWIGWGGRRRWKRSTADSSKAHATRLRAAGQHSTVPAATSSSSSSNNNNPVR